MNTRPTRAPAPPAAETGYHHDIKFQEASHPMQYTGANQLPAERQQQSALPPAGPHQPDLLQPLEPAAPASPALPQTGFSQLVGAIAAVMAEIEPVEKGGWNKFQSYAYARIQDLMGALTPLMGKHGIVIFQNEEGRAMFETAVAVRYRFTVAHKSGEVWPEQILQTGLSNCRNSKEGFDDKTLNKCHTAARKYFLLSLFQIPTEDIDEADGGTGNGEPRKRPQQQAKRPAPAPDGKMQPHTITIIDGDALLLDDDFNVEIEYQQYIQPRGWMNADGTPMLEMPQEAFAVHGLSMDFLVANGHPITSALRVYTDAVLSGRAVLGFNQQHDGRQVRAELRHAGMDDLFEQTPNACAMRSITKNYKGKVKKLNGKGGFPRLIDAAAHFGIPSRRASTRWHG